MDLVYATIMQCDTIFRPGCHRTPIPLLPMFFCPSMFPPDEYSADDIDTLQCHGDVPVKLGRLTLPTVTP
jgi:hypothetical protein